MDVDQDTVVEKETTQDLHEQYNINRKIFVANISYRVSTGHENFICSIALKRDCVKD